MDRSAEPAGWASATVWTAGALAAALAIAAGVLALAGGSPWHDLATLLFAAFQNSDRLAAALSAWSALTLCCAALLLTFAAGWWNIGIEGQVVLGAVGATAALRLAQGHVSPTVALAGAALAGALAGAAWGWLTGALKTYGRVHEIFAGLGLNFVAGSLTIYLVLGPWRPAGSASAGGTEPFPEALWLPTFGRLPVSPIELGLALLALGVTAGLLRGTSFGLRLRALSAAPRAAGLLGVPVNRYALAACALGGALAGLAGWALVAGPNTRHNLFPDVSSGFGYQALLVVLLANCRAWACAPLALLFAALGAGGLQLSMKTDAPLDSAIAGVVQGLLVLAGLIAWGLRARRRARET